MTIYMPDIAGRTGPKYRAIAEAIAADIASGELPAETRLPPHRDLAWHLGVTVGTVSRAYNEVARQGLVHGEVGRGTYVLRRSEAQAVTPLSVARADGWIDLTRNSPPQGPHGQALRETLRTISEDEGIDALLAYREEAGPLAHREAGSRWLRRAGLEVPADRLVVVGGAQQGLSIAMFALTAPGDTILAEATSYCQFLDDAGLHRRKLHPVAMDEHGLRPDALDAACRASGARLLFCIPTLHNPTCTVMPEARRREIVEVARAHDLKILEDDVYGYLPEDRPPAIATLAPERTVYVTSLSKCLSPGLRTGWLAAPEHLLPALIEAQAVTSVSQPPLPGEVGRYWIESGTADGLIAWMRRELAERHRLAAEILDGTEYAGHPASFHLLLRLPEPWTATTFAEAARERRIRVLPASAFTVEPGELDREVRLSLSQPATRQDLRRALETVRALMAERPRRARAII
jgi:DNA-binding transcriptional MocR family regulator